MKKYLALLVAPLLLGACGQNNQPGITGELEGVESDTLLVSYFPAGEWDESVNDTIVMQEGKFHFEVDDMTTPAEVFLFEKPVTKPNADGSIPAASMKRIHVVLLPGEGVKLTGSFDEYQLAGGDFYKTLNKVEQEENVYMAQLNEFNGKLMALMQAQQQGASADSVRQATDSIRMQMQDLYVNKLLKVKSDYVKEHPDEEISAYFIAQLPVEISKDLIDQLGEKAKNGMFGIYYQRLKEAIEAEELRAKAQENIQPGKDAPDFTLKDIEGNDFTLSSLKGKYVVLDFWGSWCGWCIKGIPDMKKVYAKYKNKVEFVGVDCNDTEEKWKDAVKEHELPWLHVRNEGKPDVSAMYAVTGYPTKIIIDKEGKINKVVVGESPEFYTYLEGLLK